MQTPLGHDPRWCPCGECSDYRNPEAVARRTPAEPKCGTHEGCKGEGWQWDSTDSGSGREVYCDCPAGAELKAKDATERIGPDK